MHRRSQPLGAFVVLVVVSASAWSQSQYAVPGASVRDEFSAYHYSLDSAADATLANVARSATIRGEVADVASDRTAIPEATTFHEFAQRYWNGNDGAVRRAVERVTQLRPVVAPILQEQGIPDAIMALVLVESAGQLTALSPKGARGLWQFMPYTARRYGLTVNSEIDDRLDVHKSTRAAARYLKHLHAEFGDWPLALAAYNAGEQLLRNAVLKSGAKDFAGLSGSRMIPAETRQYVPAVLAASALLRGDSLLGDRRRQVHRSSLVLFANSAGGDQK